MTSQDPEGANLHGTADRRLPPSPSPRARHHSVRVLVASICTALLLGAMLLSGTGPLDRGTVERGSDAAWTDALWTAAKPADGAFTALQLSTVRNLTCSSGLWAAATVSWERPTGTPSAGVGYRLTVQRGASTETLTQTTTTYVYRRPTGNFENVTVTIQPTMGEWTGPTQSILLTAVPLVGMRCP